MLKTPENIRELQRKLYRKAKQEKEFRFYLLYDKIYRLDILSHAYNLVKANKGAPGVDGETFEHIEEGEGGASGYLEAIAGELKRKEYKPQPVRRVYIPKASGGKRPLGIPTIKDRVVQMAVKIVIEPIFEADFQENSYGFRPKRNAHQAVDDVRKHLLQGKTEVIDADISKYFDTIPHDKLLQLVARRIVDKQILKLIKMWLKAPIVEEREDGEKEYKGNDKGTPQGGVISPLLANVYLNVLDTLWKLKKVQERLGARLVRYADDCVVLCKGNTGRILKGMKKVFSDLGLTLNEEKTKIVNAREASFTFLGFSVEMRQGRKADRLFPFTRPSKEAMKHIRSEIKQLTTEQYSAVPTGDVIQRVNRVVRGWVNYFYYGNCTKAMSSLREYLVYRMRIYRRRKHHLHSYGYRALPNSYYYETLGLYEVPRKAPWTQSAKAPGE
ncbi:MAG: group II intron reverse transcriptase/maturase [Nitrospiraceae bacterium]|nr:group II intron reverse transcriptase/maturase [Nitrospiraceae bacterium]MDA8089758.1 group II intron reverse transcriptase/maturase [Nitrospiraceae bacterium]